jgi:hypothetical protein
VGESVVRSGVAECSILVCMWKEESPTDAETASRKRAICTICCFQDAMGRPPLRPLFGTVVQPSASTVGVVGSGDEGNCGDCP